MGSSGVGVGSVSAGSPELGPSVKGIDSWNKSTQKCSKHTFQKRQNCKYFCHNWQQWPSFLPGEINKDIVEPDAWRKWPDVATNARDTWNNAWSRMVNCLCQMKTNDNYGSGKNGSWVHSDGPTIKFIEHCTAQCYTCMFLIAVDCSKHFLCILFWQKPKLC